MISPLAYINSTPRIHTMKSLHVFGDLIPVYYSSHIVINLKGFSTSDRHKHTVPMPGCIEEVIIVAGFQLHFFMGTR